MLLLICPLQIIAADAADACQGRWRHLVQGTLRPLSLQSHPSPRTETWLEKQGRTKHNQTTGPKPHETIGCRYLRLFECFAWNHCWNYCCDRCGSLALLRSSKRKASHRIAPRNCGKESHNDNPNHIQPHPTTSNHIQPPKTAIAKKWLWWFSV